MPDSEAVEKMAWALFRQQNPESHEDIWLGLAQLRENYQASSRAALASLTNADHIAALERGQRCHECNGTGKLKPDVGEVEMPCACAQGRLRLSEQQQARVLGMVFSREELRYVANCIDAVAATTHSSPDPTTSALLDAALALKESRSD